MKFASWAFLSPLLCSLWAWAGPKAVFSGKASHRFWNYTSSDDKYAGQDHWVFAEQKMEWNSNFSAKVSGYGFAGNSKADLIQDADNLNSRSQTSEVWPGDIYLQAAGGPALLKLGYQQISWQEGFGLSYTNFINARDARASVFDDPDQIFRSAPAANLILSGEHISLQGIYLPFSQHDIHPPVSRWGTVAGLMTAPGLQTFEVQDPKPWKVWNEGGGRLTWAGSGFDLSLFYARLRDRQLVYSLSPLSTATNTVLVGEQDFITPQGATTSVEIKDFILRAEYMQTPKRKWNLLTDAGLSTYQTSEKAYTVTLDSPGWEKFSFSLQHSVSMIGERPVGLVRKQIETISFLGLNIMPTTDHLLRLAGVFQASDQTFVGRASYKWPLSKRADGEVGYEAYSGKVGSVGAAMKDLNRAYFQINHTL